LRWAWPIKIGGDERIRTADPLVANEVLSQLSYIPTDFEGLARAAEQCPREQPGARMIARGEGASKKVAERVGFEPTRRY
jgi:hypothetical protein